MDVDAVLLEQKEKQDSVLARVNIDAGDVGVATVITHVGRLRLTLAIS